MIAGVVSGMVVVGGMLVLVVVGRTDVELLRLGVLVVGFAAEVLVGIASVILVVFSIGVEPCCFVISGELVMKIGELFTVGVVLFGLSMVGCGVADSVVVGSVVEQVRLFDSS